MGNRLTTLTFLARVHSGKIVSNRDEIARAVSTVDDCEMLIILRRITGRGCGKMMRAFHGPILQQIQADLMAREGRYKDVERIKAELKEQFLGKRKQHWSDGSPVIIQMPHPERKGVTFDWHLETVPSLADLSREEFRAFIDAILDHYLHEQGLDIQVGEDAFAGLELRGA